MCGLIYAQTFDGSPVNNYVLQQYDAQQHRGKEGFGLFNGTHLVKAAKESRILNWLCKEKNNSDLLLFHHRFPTSTINVRQAAHPFSTKGYFGDNQYILIHNGYIKNADELFVEHQVAGINYQSLLTDLTFNDSEALLWDVALYLEGKQPKLKAYGGIAFICMKLVNGVPDKLYFGRNGDRPLNLLRDKQAMTLSSEGEGEPIKTDQIYTYNYQLKRLTKHWLKIHEWDPEYLEKWKKNYNNVVGFQYDSHRNEHWDASRACYVPNSDLSLPNDEDDEFEGIEFQQDPYTYPDTFKRLPAPAPVPYNTEPLKPLGTLIGEAIRRRFPGRVEEQQAKLLLPGKAQDENLETRDKIIEHFISQPAIQPTHKAIEQLAFSYICGADGYFEAAYKDLEAEYMRAQKGQLNRETVKYLLLIEKAMAFLCADLEWEDDNSRSSAWEAIWATYEA